MSLDEIHLLHNDTLAIRQNTKDFASLPSIFAAQNLHEVPLSDERTNSRSPVLHANFLA
jgi:hypothetical protein